jgi:hypothetical protein
MSGNTQPNDLPLQLKILIKATEDAIQTYWRLSQEAKDDRDKWMQWNVILKHIQTCGFVIGCRKI